MLIISAGLFVGGPSDLYSISQGDARGWGVQGEAAAAGYSLVFVHTFRLSSLTYIQVRSFAAGPLRK